MKNVLALAHELAKAKRGPEEVRYLRLMQKDERLRSEIIKLGS